MDDLYLSRVDLAFMHLPANFFVIFIKQKGLEILWIFSCNWTLKSGRKIVA